MPRGCVDIIHESLLSSESETEMGTRESLLNHFSTIVEHILNNSDCSNSQLLQLSGVQSAATYSKLEVATVVIDVHKLKVDYFAVF